MNKRKGNRVLNRRCPKCGARLKINGKGELVWCSSLVCPYIRRFEWYSLCLFVLAVGLLGMGTKLCILAVTDPYFPLINLIDGGWVIIAGCYIFIKSARRAYDSILHVLQRCFKSKIQVPS